MPTEVEQRNYDHIGDAETVYMTHPDTLGTAKAPGRSFKRVWAKKGWTQTTREAYEAHLEDLRSQVSEFVASGEAAMPPADGDAQDIINAELASSSKARHVGGATSGKADV